MAITHFKQILQRWAEQVDNHDIVIALLPRPHYPWYARTTHESFVNLAFLLQWTIFCYGRLELDGDLLPRDRVHTHKHGTLEDCLRLRRELKIETRSPQPPVPTISSSIRYLPPNVGAITFTAVENVLISERARYYIRYVKTHVGAV